MNNLIEIPIEAIDASGRLRSINPEQAAAIKASILDIGLSRMARPLANALLPRCRPARSRPGLV